MPVRDRRRRSAAATFIALAAVLALLLAACETDPTASPSVTPTPPAARTPPPTPAITESPSPSPSPSPVDGTDAAAGLAYLALGDSVTFGVGVPQPQRNGYVGRLMERLVEANPPFTDLRVFAVPGETATGFLERRLDDVLASVEELGPRVGLVTVGLGANELLRIARDPACRADRESADCLAAVATATSRAAQALDAVVEGVQDALARSGSAARILLLAYYNPDAEPVAARTIIGPDGVVACDPGEGEPGLNDRIACVAERRGVELVDLYSAFLGREAELTHIERGDVHPNSAGYEVIADTIADHIGLAE